MHFNALLLVTLALLSTIIAFPTVGPEGEWPSNRNDKELVSLGLRFDNGDQETVPSRHATAPAAGSAKHQSRVSNPPARISHSQAATSSVIPGFYTKEEIAVVNEVTFAPIAYREIWAVPLRRDSDFDRELLIEWYVSCVNAMKPPSVTSSKILDIGDIDAAFGPAGKRTLNITVNFYSDTEFTDLIHTTAKVPGVERKDNGFHISVSPRTNPLIYEYLADLIKEAAYMRRTPIAD